MVTAPANNVGPTATAGHSLTLDGQGGTDTYNVWTTGSVLATARNYVINILDSGAENDGVDEAFIHSPYEDLAGNPAPTDDIFLARAITCIDTETLSGLTTAASVRARPRRPIVRPS